MRSVDGDADGWKEKKNGQRYNGVRTDDRRDVERYSGHGTLPARTVDRAVVIRPLSYWK